jgi:hypothetical protein
MGDLSLVWSVFHNIVTFVLVLYSTDEREYGDFSLLNLTNLIKDDVLQLHPFTCKWQNFIIPYGWI